MNVYSKNLTLSAMLIALAVLFPLILHAVGLGSAFLPLFWPIAAAIFLLPLSYACSICVLAPLVSFLFTGMPPISPPILQVMLAELLSMVLVGYVFYHKFKISTFWSLVAGLLASRVVLFFIVGLLAPLLRLPAQIFSTVWLIRGIPGIIIILVVIPILVSRLKNEKLQNILVFKRN